MEALQVIIPSGVVLGLVGILLRVSGQMTAKYDAASKRITDVQKLNDQRFVNKDVCKVLHEALAADVKEIKADLKELIRRNGG